jgi:hypothetical protein
VRLALTGTPRSGNAWLRLLLGDAYACETLSSHSPEEVPWEALPADVVLQLHQHADPAFTSVLEEHGFRVVVLARHPLDVLISILHFARNDPSPARWLDGEGGDEVGITTCTPLDPAFLEYATGPRARTLLALSREWWTRPETSKIKYEDLCANAAGELQALVAKLSPPRAPLEQVVRAHTLDRLRRALGVGVDAQLHVGSESFPQGAHHGDVPLDVKGDALDFECAEAVRQNDALGVLHH